jgi:fluoroquinolone transport system permease protein
MKMLGFLFAGEIRRLFKYKIIFFSFLVSAIWVAIIALSDPATAEGLAPTLIVTDAGMMSIVLLGASFFFEKQEETLKTLLVTPAPVWAILLAKVASAMAAGLVSMVLVAGSAWLIHGVAVNFLLLGLYVLVIVAGNTAIGYVMILVSRDFMSMLVKFAGLMIAFYVPSLLVPLGIIPAEFDFVGILSPVYAGSLLIQSLYQPVETWKLLLALLFLAGIAAALYPSFIYRRFQKVAIEG